MAYTRIPQSNTTRNENQLRATIDQLIVAVANLNQINDKMSQMNLDGGGQRLAAEYNLVSDAEASEIYSLVSSTVSEFETQSPFFNQLTSRLG